MTRFTLLCTLLWCSAMVQGQYTIHLERGDSISAASYYTRGDSLGYPGGKVAFSEALYIRTGNEVYVVKYPNGAIRQVRIRGFGTPCSIGTLYAQRYENAQREEQNAVLNRLAEKEVPEYATCFKSALAATGTDLDRPDRPGLDKGTTAIAVAKDMVILRSGDTLVTVNNMHMVGDSLDWSDQFPRVHKDQVLLLLTKSGQKIIHPKRATIIPLDPPVPDLSSCSKGLIYADLYFGTGTEWKAIPNIGPTMEENNALDCFITEEGRLRQRYPKREKSTSSLPAYPTSFISIGAGAGTNFGMIGMKSVLGPKGSGILIGVGTLDGNFCYQVGAQLAIRAWFINFGYGTYEVGTYRNFNGPEKKYQLEGLTIATGAMGNIIKNRRLFIEGSVGYTTGGTRPAGPQTTGGGITFNAGLGYRIGSYK